MYERTTWVADAQLPFLKKSNSFIGISTLLVFNYRSNFVFNKLVPINSMLIW